MASQKQIAANRANALKSTGPRSAAGRARSSQNASKHGLAAKRNPEMDFEVATYVEFFLAENGCSGTCQERQQILSEMFKPVLQIRRIGAMQIGLVRELLKTSDPSIARELTRLERYERYAQAKLRKALSDAED